MRGPQQEVFQQQQQQQQQQQEEQDQQLKPSIEQEEKQQQQQQHKDESRLAKVKRVLSGSLLLGRSSSNNNGGGGGGGGQVSARSSFGVELELAEPHNESGVPRVVHRLCAYIEAYGFHNPALFRLASGSSKLADRLKLAFERRGDADLEATACPATAALLLRQYLKDLPKPIVGATCISKLLQLHSRDRGSNRECWIDKTRELLANELPASHHRLLAFLVHFLARFEGQHGSATGVCGIFAPVLLPHVPPATVLLRDLLLDAALIFPDYNGVKESTVNSVNGVNGVIPSSDCKVCKDPKDDFGHPSDNTLLVCSTKPPKRKDRRDSCGQDRKLIRSNSEEKIWESSKRTAGDSSTINAADTIRRVSSHEDFNSTKHLHILSKLQKDMGHGLRHGSLPLHERTNVSPVSSKTSLIHSSSDVVLATEKYDCDAERLRNSERFSRGITPRGRRQVRRRKLYRSSFDQNASKENDIENSEVIFTLTSDSNKTNSQSQSFLEMLSSGPSRAPSPVRPPSLEQDDENNPTLANWSFQIRQNDDEEMDERVEAMVSPRNSLLIPRRFYSEDDTDEEDNVVDAREYTLKNLVKQINSLKKKIKKYENELEENMSCYSDKMSNREIKRIVSVLNKVRKEHKLLKEGFASTLLGCSKFDRDEGVSVKNNHNNNNNNNNGEENIRATAMLEMVKEVDRKLADKRFKYNRSENMEDLSYSQLLDEKTAMQKALLHIENTFGRPVSKEDRSIVRPLYDKYRTLKRLLIRAGANQCKDSMPELATILEHEAMDFTSASGSPIDCDRRASEPDMSNRGILDCIDSMEQVPTDSDSQPSSSDGSRGIVESLHSLSKDELLQQHRITKEEKKRLRRALKELEIQFEARAGRRMHRKDRGPQVNIIYDSYKQTKARLKLISALLAKTA